MEFKVAGLGLAIAVAVFGMDVAFAQEPAPAAGAARLEYELPVDALQRGLRADSKADLETVLAETVRRLQYRVGDDAIVARAGATGFTVTVDAAVDLPKVRRRIERVGALELRMVAVAPTKDGDFPFDLAAERQRLQAWLAAGGKERVLRDASALAEFHADAERGPVAHGKLRWCVRRLRADPMDSKRWARSLTQSPAVAPACVPLYEEAQWEDGPPAASVGESAPSLIELIAIDHEQRGFDHQAIDPESVRAVTLASGTGIGYEVVEARREAYGVWSARNLNRASAVLWDGEVISTPIFQSVISRNGMIHSQQSQEEAEEFASILRSGPLPAAPRLRNERPTAR
ncbi:MAG: hypothetical protein IPK26_25490 [Planctomycetes bacterium]|nr:hypothetical protein [Planctomycetota bacterium]